eukprot:Amastigsp_a177065_21.p2 type:complete len:295 gc:universal Amastigsp_a177065_21:906-22(-)
MRQRGENEKLPQRRGRREDRYVHKRRRMAVHKRERRRALTGEHKRNRNVQNGKRVRVEHHQIRVGLVRMRHRVLERAAKAVEEQRDREEDNAQCGGLDARTLGVRLGCAREEEQTDADAENKHANHALGRVALAPDKRADKEHRDGLAGLADDLRHHVDKVERAVRRVHCGDVKSPHDRKLGDRGRVCRSARSDVKYQTHQCIRHALHENKRQREAETLALGAVPGGVQPLLRERIEGVRAEDSHREDHVLELHLRRLRQQQPQAARGRGEMCPYTRESRVERRSSIYQIVRRL